jgi:hypothetical protein
LNFDKILFVDEALFERDEIGRIVQCYTPIADSATATLESRSTIHRQAERVIVVYMVIDRGALLQQTTHTYCATCTANPYTCDSRGYSTVANAKTKRAKKVNKQTRVSDSPYASSRKKVR